MQRSRTSGILLHPTSLPGRHGSGDLGPEAHAFLGELERAKIGLWQMLPIAPPGYGESPYSAQSAFAGSPWLVSLDLLAERGWLAKSAIANPPVFPDDRVDFAPMSAWRERHLRVAHDVFRQDEDAQRHYEAFQARESEWLGDFALYRAIKRSEGNVEWTKWPRDLKLRTPGALKKARLELADEIAFETFVQFCFDEQWQKLHAAAKKKNVALVGDIPIFVAHDSADVWQKPHEFFLDGEGNPTVISGVPPDYFSTTGQRWGNPLYRWKRMKKGGYAWWVSRLQTMLRRFDRIRVDHFIGFQRYWRIDASEPTAVNGKWMKGPGADFFQTLRDRLGPLPLIAEDLGAVTPAVFALRDRFELPGIKILQFAFGTDPNKDTFLPHNYPKRSVVYTGTHDNDTTVGWFFDEGGSSSTRSKDEIVNERAAVLRYLGSTTQEDIHWQMIRAGMASVADTAIFPMQDVLGLGSEARMNRPGRADGNWAWRMKPGAFGTKEIERLAELS
ncbi:MAG TPA: 4-alpha-glucanotransferase, partial [Polyangiaceae bacterium]